MENCHGRFAGRDIVDSGSGQTLLFREIPIRCAEATQTLSSPKQRKITEGTVDLVTNKWLSLT
jgi:hypothetical protein